MQHDASEQPYKQMQNKNHWKKPKNGGGKGKSLKIGGDWKPESLSTLISSVLTARTLYNTLNKFFEWNDAKSIKNS